MSRDVMHNGYIAVSRLQELKDKSNPFKIAIANANMGTIIYIPDKCEFKIGDVVRFGDQTQQIDMGIEKVLIMKVENIISQIVEE